MMKFQYQSTWSLEKSMANLAPSSPFPITLQGTVKVHGQNVSVLTDPSGEIQEVRTRRKILSQEDVLFGAYQFMHQHASTIRSMCLEAARNLPASTQYNTGFRITGELCGNGVQAGVALSDLPNLNWFVFDIRAMFSKKLVENMMQKIRWVNLVDRPFAGVVAPIHIITKFPTFKLEVNGMDDIERVLAEAAQLSIQVGNHCPVGAQLGLDGIGEGIVWDGVSSNSKFMMFRGKTKSPDFVHVVHGEPLRSDWKPTQRIATLVNPERLAQARQYLVETRVDPGDRSTALPSILEWIRTDIEREEKKDCDDVDWEAVSDYVQDQFVFASLQQPNIEEIIMMVRRFVADDGAERLVFPRSLTFEDRMSVFRLCKHRPLEAHTFGDDDERHTVVSKLRSDQLVSAWGAFVRDHDINTNKNGSKEWRQRYDHIIGIVDKYQLYEDVVQHGADEWLSTRNEIIARMMDDIYRRCTPRMLRSIDYPYLHYGVSPRSITRDIYQEKHDGKDFVSIEIRDKEFGVLVEFYPGLFQGCSSWGEYVARFTDHEYFQQATGLARKMIQRVHTQFLTPVSMKRASKALLRVTTNKLITHGYGPQIVFEGSRRIILSDDGSTFDDIVSDRMMIARFRLHYLPNAKCYAEIHPNGRVHSKKVPQQTALETIAADLQRL
jgi:hypothetical protein